MSGIEGYSGIYPGMTKLVSGFDESSDMWRGLRVNSQGFLRVTTFPPEADSTSIDLDTSLTQIGTGEGWVMSVTNTSSEIVNIYDGATIVAHLLPLQSLLAPIFVHTSASIALAQNVLGPSLVSASFLPKAQ